MNFARLSGQFVEYKKAKTVILPIPFGGEGEFGEQFSRSPEAILRASAGLSLFDIATRSEPFRKGIYTHNPLQLTGGREDVFLALEQQVSPFFRDDKIVVSLGGDPSISEGLIKSALNRYEDLTVLRLDAQANRLMSGIMGRIESLCPSVILGVRSMEKSEWETMDRDHLILARDLVVHGLSAALDALDLLSEHVYLSIDMDVFDPAFVPFVPSPEPGGLDWYLINSIIREVSSERKIVGVDLTGLLPQADSPAPDYLAAKLIYRILSMHFSQQLTR